MNRPSLPRLMLVTDRRRAPAGDPVDRIVEAVAGGVGIVQFREPGLDDASLGQWIERVRSRAGSAVTLVVNGRPDLARRLGVGLHLPAYRPGGPAGAPRCRPFGRSVHDPEEAERAAAERPDYLVVGTFYPTPSKPGHPGTGTRGLGRIFARLPHIPLYAIGGIDATRVAEALDAGAHGVAVCGAILAADDAGRAAGALAAAIRRAVAQGRNEARRTRARAGSTQAT